MPRPNDIFTFVQNGLAKYKSFQSIINETSDIAIGNLVIKNNLILPSADDLPNMKGAIGVVSGGVLVNVGNNQVIPLVDNDIIYVGLASLELRPIDIGSVYANINTAYTSPGVGNATINGISDSVLFTVGSNIVSPNEYFFVQFPLSNIQAFALPSFASFFNDRSVESPPVGCPFVSVSPIASNQFASVFFNTLDLVKMGSIAYTTDKLANLDYNVDIDIKLAIIGST